MWALSRFDDVLGATLDPKTYSSQVGGRGPGNMFINVDPPVHTPRRNLISAVFTPRAIARLEPWIREITLKHHDALEGRERFDLIGDFAQKLPLEVICVMLGIPEADRGRLQSFGDRYLARDPGERTPAPDAAVAYQAFLDYFAPIDRDRRANPRDDLLTRLAGGEVRHQAGEIGPIDEKEFGENGLMLTTAGNETTTKLIDNLVFELWRNPDQRTALVRDPSLIPAAVEESLRHDAPSQWQNRVAAMHLGLGYGHHICLGKSLARLEGRVATEELLRRYPDYELLPDGLQRTYASNVSGYSAMPTEVVMR